MRRGKAFLNDVLFLVWLLLVFGAAVFSLLDEGGRTFHLLLCGATLLLSLVAYFVPFGGAVLACALFALLYSAAVAGLALYTGYAVEVRAFFWLAWTPLLVLTLAALSAQSRALGKENLRLHGAMFRLSTIDDGTGLGNLRAFETEARVYMKISRRYRLELMLLTCAYRDPDVVREALGAKRFEALTRSIAEELRVSIRAEDAIYLLEPRAPRIGILMFTHPAEIRAVTDRIRLLIRSLARPHCVRPETALDPVFCAAVYDGSEMTPLALLNRAEPLEEKST